MRPCSLPGPEARIPPGWGPERTRREETPGGNSAHDRKGHPREEEPQQRTVTNPMPGGRRETPETAVLSNSGIRASWRGSQRAGTIVSGRGGMKTAADAV